MKWEDADGQPSGVGHDWKQAQDSEPESPMRKPGAIRLHKAMLGIVALAAAIVVFNVAACVGSATERSRRPAATSPSVAADLSATTIAAETVEQPATTEAATTEAAATGAATTEVPMAEAPEPEVLTADNCPALASVLAGSDQDFGAFESFGSEYSGKTIQFDAHVADMQRVEGTKTRFNVLICAGDYGATYTGPNFQYHDVNFYGMHVEPSSVDSLAAGMNVRVTATVASYNKYSSMIELLPVETLVR